MRVADLRHEKAAAMGIEIERKFLVRADGWRRDVVDEVPIVQGYFARTPLLRARIRLYGDKAYITLKSQPGPRARLEFEYEIPRTDAEEIIHQFSIEPLISKVRHQVMHEGTLWSVDVFNGANLGLVVAEVELETVDQAVVLPSWVGAEVTSDIRYGNSNLARFPFVSWPCADVPRPLRLSAMGAVGDREPETVMPDSIC